MNEKLIGDLFVEAQRLVEGSSSTEFAKKFAELIVKECAELTLDYKNDEHYNGWLDYRDEIKKHFGVE